MMSYQNMIQRRSLANTAPTQTKADIPSFFQAVSVTLGQNFSKIFGTEPAQSAASRIGIKSSAHTTSPHRSFR